MTLRITQWTLDVHDVSRMAEFWSSALGYRIVAGDDGSAKLYPPADAAPEVLAVWLQAGAARKQAKNRSHPDLNLVLDSDGVDDEVRRLEALGARRTDVGQVGDEPFVVMADPEDNEFCVLRRQPRMSDASA